MEKDIFNRSFFNKDWSSEQIIEAVRKGYMKLALNGDLKVGRNIVSVMGDNITIILNEKKLISTAYGSFRYSLKDFGF